MFGNALRIDVGPDWHHIYVHTDSWAVAAILVLLTILAIFLLSACAITLRARSCCLS